MKNIAVDFGNSRIKVGIFDKAKLLQKFSVENLEGLRPILAQQHDSIIVCSVKGESDIVLQMSTAIGIKIKLTVETPLPVQIQYATPHSLGVDRISAVCGAQQLFPNQDCLIIDMGTCINYELVDLDGVYQGGIISPGVAMRFQAMHTFTAKLPLIQATAGPNLIGDSTMACMQSGVMNGIQEEVKGIMAQLKMKYPRLITILCGGDAAFFENQLKPTIFAAPELVLVGLNRILIHNAAK